MDIQENENYETNIFCKENHYFASETFLNTVNEALKTEEYKNTLKNTFAEINIPHVNSKITNSFTNFLKKIEKENLLKFLELLPEINFGGKLFLATVSEGLLGFLHERFPNQENLVI